MYIMQEKDGRKGHFRQRELLAQSRRGKNECGALGSWWFNVVGVLSGGSHDNR